MKLTTDGGYEFDVEYYDEPDGAGPETLKFVTFGNMEDDWDDEIRYDVFMAIVEAAKAGKFDDDALIKEMANDVKELDKKFEEDDEMPGHGDKTDLEAESFRF